MDLQTLGARLEARDFYLTLEILVADLRRMLANARVYNSPESEYCKAANKGDLWLDSYLERHVVYQPAAGDHGAA